MPRPCGHRDAGWVSAIVVHHDVEGLSARVIHDRVLPISADLAFFGVVRNRYPMSRNRWTGIRLSRDSEFFAAGSFFGKTRTTGEGGLRGGSGVHGLAHDAAQAAMSASTAAMAPTSIS